MNLKPVFLQGLHDQDFYNQIKDCWQNDRPAIIYPPHLKPNENKISYPNEFIFGIYTSGTLSGKPRLVFYTKENINTSLNAIRNLFIKIPFNKIFCYPQPAHTFGLILGYLQSIIYEIPLVFHRGSYGSEAHAVWAKEVTERTLTLGTPTHFVDLIEWTEKNNVIVKPSLATIIGGAAVSKKLWNEIKQKLKVEFPSVGYGATEASPGITHLEPGVEPYADGDIGKVLENVKIFDRDEKGFQFSGQNVCAAIWHDGKLSFEKAIQIQDKIILKEDHYIFQGRSDLLINRGGLKFSPELLESKVYSELKIRIVCVSLFSERLGEDIGCLVQESENENNAIEKVQSFLKAEFNLKLQQENFLLGVIPLNQSAKLDRLEVKKIILKKKQISLPINVKYLVDFLPHRESAIWINQITAFQHRSGEAEVFLDSHSNIYSKSNLRESACIELVAQTYGYAVVAYEIFSASEQMRANKTLIAEIRNAHFYFTENNVELLQKGTEQKKSLTVKTQCTHDFGVIKLFTGQVFLGDVKLAELSLKAFVN